jgi:hypothetical protein
VSLPFTIYQSRPESCFFFLQLSGWQVFLKGQWATDVFVTNYIPFVLFFILYAGARIWKRSKFIQPEDMDFKTGLDIVEAASYDEPPPRNWVEKVWAWLVSRLCVVSTLRIFVYKTRSDVIQFVSSTRSLCMLYHRMVSCSVVLYPVYLMLSLGTLRS